MFQRRTDLQTIPHRRLSVVIVEKRVAGAVTPLTDHCTFETVRNLPRPSLITRPFQQQPLNCAHRLM